MAGFQSLVTDFVGGNGGAVVMVDSSGVETTPGTVISDTLRLKNQAQGLHADADGTVALVSPRGGSRTFTVKAGVYYPYRFVQIKATGTTLTAAQIGILFLAY